jgi:hypothetical protein
LQVSTIPIIAIALSPFTPYNKTNANTMATTTVFHSIRREEQDKLARKRFLQRLLHDDSKSIIERTKARVELALLTSDAAADQHADDDDEDDIHQMDDITIKHTGLVSRIAAERERDIQRNAERQRREEIILRLIAQLKEQGALMSEARRLRLEKELEQAVEDMEQWEKDYEDAKEENEGEVANKEAFSEHTPPMIRRDFNGSCSEKKKDDSSFQEQLTSFREEQQRQQMRNITLPPSFYKSSLSLLGVVAPEEAQHPQGQGEEEEKNNKSITTHHRSKEISSDSWERRQTHDTADTLSVESDSTASTVEITNVPMGESSPNPPPHGSKEISDCWPTPDTADKSSVQSDSSESTVEINNASSMRLVGDDDDSPNNRTASLERQIQMLLKEAELREESMQMMAMELEQTQRKNEKRIDKLKSHLVKVSKELEDYPRQLQYWKQKSLELSKKVYTLEVELDEKEESIEDLVEYKYSQDVKIDSLEREVETLRLERRRDRAEEVVEQLLVPPKREIIRSASASMMDMAIDTTMNSCVSIATTEEEETIRRLEEEHRKDEEQTKVDVSALEVRVARIAQEKAEMQAELEEMRLLLAEASAKAEQQEERKEQRKKKKKSTTNKGPSQLIYQVSCRKCPKGKNCAVVGVTTEDLKSKVLALAQQSVVVAASSGKKTGRLINPSSFTGLKLDTSSFNLGSLLDNNHSSSNCSVGDLSRLTEETTNEDAFIQHLASHIPKKVAKNNEKEALSFCKKIVKVEVLKKETGEELYWHDSIEE